MIVVYVLYLLATQLLGIVCSQILSHHFIDVILDMFLACLTEVPVSIIASFSVWSHLSYKIFAICTNWHCINLQVLQFHCYLNLISLKKVSFSYGHRIAVKRFRLHYFTETIILSGSWEGIWRFDTKTRLRADRLLILHTIFLNSLLILLLKNMNSHELIALLALPN